MADWHENVLSSSSDTAITRGDRQRLFAERHHNLANLVA